MNTQIREATFETNSSSSHSFVANGPICDYDTIVPNEQGEIHITPGGTFGWGYEEYSDPMTKLEYIFLDIGRENIELCRIACEHIKQHTGAKSVTLHWNEIENGDYWDNYIDHQSIGTGASLVDETGMHFIEIVFGSNAVLVIDNDNH